MEKRIKDVHDYKPVVTSIVKKDVNQLEAYVKNLNSILKDPGVVALRICECCINISITRPGEDVMKFSIK